MSVQPFDVIVLTADVTAHGLESCSTDRVPVARLAAAQAALQAKAN